MRSIDKFMNNSVDELNAFWFQPYFDEVPDPFSFAGTNHHALYLHRKFGWLLNPVEINLHFISPNCFHGILISG